MKTKHHILPRCASQSDVAGDNVLARLASIINLIKALQQSYDDIGSFGQGELLTNADSRTLFGMSVPGDMVYRMFDLRH